MPKILERPIPDDVAQGRMLSAKEAMVFLGVSKRTLNDMTHHWKDRLPSYRIGKKRKYKLDELRWWIENHREPV